jgi:O-antigen ligase
MEKNLKFVNLFVTGIFLSSALVFPFVLDFTLVPRHICLTAFIAVIIYSVYRTKAVYKIQLDPILLFLACYCIFCCASICWSINKAEAIFEASKQVLLLLVFSLTYFFLKLNKDRFLNALLKSAVVLFYILLLTGLYQYNKIENLNKESIYLITGLNGHKNLFSSFLFLNLFFLLMASYKLSGHWKTASIASIALCLLLIFLLKTKAVWLGLGIAVLIGMFLYVYTIDAKVARSNFRISIAAILLIIIANIFFLKILQPVIKSGISYTKETRDSALVQHAPVKLDEERMIIWDKTYHVFKKNPLFGVGLGNWQIQYPDAILTGLWRVEDLNYTFQRPHNDFLWILSETGLLGFNLFIAFLTLILLYLLKTINIPGNYKDRGFFTFSFAAIISYYLISFFDFPKERIEHTIWIGVLLGWSYYEIKSGYPLRNLKTTTISGGNYLIALLVVSFILVVGALRLKGEFHTRRMYDFKNMNRKAEVITTATSALSFAYNTDPTSVPIQWYSGNARAALGDYAGAFADFKMAYTHSPFNRNVLNDLASACTFNGDIISAKKYYEEAARVSPRFDDPKLNLAAIYINEKNFQMATFWLNSLLHDSERRSNYQKIIELQK